ncbi:MAG TPA: hypothetical protein VH206_11775 [Xanthobacteraceae bacterium]|jgi:hypothetical protein|nr:hypothetical protein [Xanthobacteraceae bacterium]
MTSENQPGRRPPTINLTATEVENPAAAKDDAAKGVGAEDGAADSVSPQTASEAAPDQKPEAEASPASGGGRSYALIALVGVVVIAAAAGGLWYKGLIPGQTTWSQNVSSDDHAPPPAAAPSTSSTANSDVTARLDKIEHALQTPARQEPAPIPPALTNRLNTTEAQNKSLTDSIAALKQRIDDIAAASQSAAKQAASANAAANAAQSSLKTNVQDSVKEAMHSADQSGALKSDLDALNDRVAGLENAVKALAEKETQAAATTNDQPLRLALAASALRSEVERGAPYQAELAAAKALGADQEAVAALEAFAASGVPSARALANALAALAPELRQSAVTTSDASFLGKLKANAEKLVEFTPINAPPGNDPSSVTARVAIDAEHTDIEAALTDIANLPDKTKPLAADWVKKAQARDAAIAASRRIAEDAMAAMTKPAAP